MENNNTSKKSPEELRTRYIRARVSETEYVKISNLAKRCGLSLSNYFRKCVLGQHPKCRLTEKEIEALNLTLTMRHPFWIFLFFGGRIATFAPV